MSRSLGAFDSYSNFETFGIAPEGSSSWDESAKSTPTWDSYCTTNNEQIEEGTFSRILPYLYSWGKSAINWGESAIKKAYNFDNLVELAENIIDTPINVSGDDPEDDKSGKIPGFPYESVVAGLTLGIVMLYLSNSNRRG
ncbi:hypothetical protein ES703_44373 [subsurface metagenome]